MEDGLADKRPAEKLSEALESYLKKSGLSKRMQQASVIADWPQIVGSQIADVTRPTAVAADGTLFVAVRSAAWAQELQLMSPAILTALGKRGKRIKRIVWRAE